MAERKEYDEATKAAVMAALLTGQSVSAVAREYNIPKGTVNGWKRQAASFVMSRGVATVATQKREQIGELLFDYLHAMLMTLRVQAEHFGDKTWLTGQHADSLAVLHGVSADKVVRLLEAITSSEATDGETPTS